MNGAIHWMDGMVVSRETIIVVVLHQVEVARGFIDINTFQPNEKESTFCTFNTHLLVWARLYYTCLFAFTNILKLTNKSESLGQHTHVVIMLRAYGRESICRLTWNREIRKGQNPHKNLPV